MASEEATKTRRMRALTWSALAGLLAMACVPAEGEEGDERPFFNDAYAYLASARGPKEALVVMLHVKTGGARQMATTASTIDRT